MSDQPSNQEEIKSEETLPNEAAQEAPAVEEQQEQPSPSLEEMFANQLSSIKNEQGKPKYGDVSTALDALKSSQEYIPELKSENQRLQAELEELRKERERMSNFEQEVERLRQPSQSQETAEATPASGQLTYEQVQELLNQELARRETEQKYSVNSNEVQQALQGAYGDKAAEIMSQKANELGMTTDQLVEMSKTSPKAAKQLLGLSGQSHQGGYSATRSSVNIPVSRQVETELERPKHSLMYGASIKDQVAFARQCKAAVNKQLGVQE